jgi:hypothetical protein
MTRSPRAALLLAVVPALLLSGCVRRVPTHSPRIPPTEEHLAAKTSADCLACHEASSLRPDHSAADECRQCHKICHGRTE